ncbi:hypothetical protein SAMN04489723_110116 [Algoriphagus aquimarinus]|uniref:Uncharacterized protein n=1 Tax=Algoriphagus aquimarinus TaxID=237018 RepID=A0A1I1B3S9_9BACT|nr:hypothetical protein SAMN04489723_110116 [Algoriphagus aquimarinus]
MIIKISKQALEMIFIIITGSVWPLKNNRIIT